MKTTVDLPDELLIAAKKRAAELRCSLRSLIERGLRQELASHGAGRKATRRRIRGVTVRGGLPAGPDVGDRAAMHDWLVRAHDGRAGRWAAAPGAGLGASVRRRRVASARAR